MQQSGKKGAKTARWPESTQLELQLEGYLGKGFLRTCWPLVFVPESDKMEMKGGDSLEIYFA